MPTYDYECDACGHAMELFQGINDPIKKKCPECGKSKLKRLFGTGAAIVFKGSGFYQTDYRSEGYKKAAQAEKKSTSEAGSSSKSDSGKSDSGKSDSGKSESGKSESSKVSESKTKSSDGGSSKKSTGGDK